MPTFQKFEDSLNNLPPFGLGKAQKDGTSRDGSGPHGRGDGPGKGKGCSTDATLAEHLKDHGLYVSGKTHVAINPKQLAMGIKVEKEHSPDEEVAKQIALDHLVEDAEYYTHLAEMEKKAVEPKKLKKSQNKYKRKWRGKSGQWEYEYDSKKIIENVAPKIKTTQAQQRTNRPKKGSVHLDDSPDMVRTRESLARMQSEFGKIDYIEPDSKIYQKMSTYLDQFDDASLQKIADMDIKWLSSQAQNRVAPKATWLKDESGAYISVIGGKEYAVEKNASGDWHLYVNGDWSTEVATLKAGKKLASEKAADMSKSGPTKYLRRWKDAKGKWQYAYRDAQGRVKLSSTNETFIPTKLSDKEVKAVLKQFRRRAPGEGREKTIQSRHDLEVLLTKSTFAMVSAGRNPDNPEDMKLSDADIKARHGKLVQELKAKGYIYTNCRGKYENPEESIMVMAHDADKQELMDIGAMFNQDSVLFCSHGKNALVYTTGDKAGQTMAEGTGREYLPDADDFYTKMPVGTGGNVKFSMSLQIWKALKTHFNELRKATIFSAAKYRSLKKRGTR